MCCKKIYQIRGDFCIANICAANSYEVHQYDNFLSAVRKYKGTELYLLPPSLFPHEPLDTMDERHLNATHAQMMSPLKRPLHTEL